MERRRSINPVWVRVWKRFNLSRHGAEIDADAEGWVRIAAAIAAARERAGSDESLDDFLRGEPRNKFVEAEKSALSDLIVIYEAASRLATRRLVGDLDPGVSAAMLLFPAPTGIEPSQHAESILGVLSNFSKLPADAGTRAGASATRGRGRPISRDPITRVVVRASMHLLHDSGRAISGGWKRTQPAREMVGRRTEDEEWALSGAAKFVTSCVKGAGLEVTLREIKLHMDEYVHLLNTPERRGVPQTRDYMPGDHSQSDGNCAIT